MLDLFYGDNASTAANINKINSIKKQALGIDEEERKVKEHQKQALGYVFDKKSEEATPEEILSKTAKGEYVLPYAVSTYNLFNWGEIDNTTSAIEKLQVLRLYCLRL